MRQAKALVAVLPIAVLVYGCALEKLGDIELADCVEECALGIDEADEELEACLSDVDACFNSADACVTSCASCEGDEACDDCYGGCVDEAHACVILISDCISFGDVLGPFVDCVIQCLAAVERALQ